MGTLIMNRGDSFSCNADMIGDPVAGTLFSFTVRRNASETGKALIKKDNKARGGVMVVDRVLAIDLDPADTLALPNESFIYRYEITQKGLGGEFYTLDGGEFQVRSNISH